MSTTETYRRFVEIADASTIARVDAATGRVNGVKLLGPKSKNGREYTDQAMREATPLYKGRKVYLNHPRRKDVGEDRLFQDWVGEIVNPRYVPGEGIYGDIVLRKESPHYAAIIEAASKFANNFGCSHVANGDSSFRNGVEVVSRITEVQSVDLVTEPATCDGLYESASTIFSTSAPYADCTSKPLDTLHNDFDRWMIDCLYHVTLAYRDGRSEPLSDLSARLRVLANEISWFSSRPFFGDGSDARVAAMRTIVYSLEDVLVNPTQPGAIATAERWLDALAHLLHDEPGRTPDHIQPTPQADGLDGSGNGTPGGNDGGLYSDPNYESRWQQRRPK